MTWESRTADLASTYTKQDRWYEAEEPNMPVMESRDEKESAWCRMLFHADCIAITFMYKAGSSYGGHYTNGQMCTVANAVRC